MNSGTTLWEKKKDNKVREMIYAARDLFEKKGYDETSVKEICDAVMLSRTTFFNYFGSKDGLIRTILLDDIDVLRETTGNHFKKTDDPLGALRLALNMMLKAAQNFPVCSTVAHKLMLSDEGFASVKKGYLSITAEYIRIARERGLLKDNVSESDALYLINGCYFSAIFDMDGDKPLEKIRMESAINTIFDLLKK